MLPNIAGVRKLDAAREQLREAIRLFFEKRSAIAIHTLVMASHQLLHDYTDRAKSMLKNDRLISEYGKERIHRFNKEFNFFKHSVGDQDEILRFDQELHTYFLVDAISLFAAATREWPREHKVFNFWFILKHPHMVDSDVAKDAVRVAKEGGWVPERLDMFLELLDHRRQWKFNAEI